MPIIKSAKKRVRTSHKATVRNSKTKRSLKSAVKAFQTSLGGDKNKVATAHSKAQSEIAKAGKKKIMHKNKVARKQRQLAAAAKAAGAPVAKKAAAPAKKTPAKKPVRQAQGKPATKKPATKKS